MSRRRKRAPAIRTVRVSKTGRKTKKYIPYEGGYEPWQFDPPILRVHIPSGLAVWYRDVFNNRKDDGNGERVVEI